uniref:Ketoreductase domain-containing protein n=1 Tax=Attheya septentrionalis TaxID=420275 RepID=A0A7S2UN27_9STRA|mmetsp:Transcript_29295/g.53617  ORF Transcript_29295/g.53617 Transcript_29295/m.53617 type:complete len:382 (+) Transcript_29295:209-1354(+)
MRFAATASRRYMRCRGTATAAAISAAAMLATMSWSRSSSTTVDAFGGLPMKVGSGSPKTTWCMEEKPSPPFPSSQRTVPPLRMSDTDPAVVAADSLLEGFECNEKTKRHFEGLEVLLTGATGGLGRALALQLASCGAKTLVLSGRKEIDLKSVASECRTLNPSISIEIELCDLSDLNAAQTMGEMVAISNDIDVLINNGGISSRSTFLETASSVDELVMKVNFLSGATIAKAVVPGMIMRNSGAIVWISSVQGLVGLPSRTSYAASKFAVQGYCESLRAELATSGVSVHVVSPGYIRTNLSMSAIKGDGEAYGKMDDTTANGASPHDVAVKVLESVADGTSDLIVAAGLSAKIAIWLRFFAPSFLNSMLVKRFEKSCDEKN